MLNHQQRRRKIHPNHHRGAKKESRQRGIKDPSHHTEAPEGDPNLGAIQRKRDHDLGRFFSFGEDVLCKEKRVTICSFLVLFFIFNNYVCAGQGAGGYGGHALAHGQRHGVGGELRTARGTAGNENRVTPLYSSSAKIDPPPENTAL